MQIWVAIVFLSCSQPRKAKVSGSNKHKINIAGQQQSLNHNKSNNKERTITVFLSSAKSSSKKRFQAQLSTSPPLRIVLGDWSCKKVSLWFHFSQSLMMQQRHHCWNLSQLVTLGTFPSQQCCGSAGSLPRSIWKSFPPGGETVPLICVFSRKPEQVFFPHRCLCPSTSSVHHG